MRSAWLAAAAWRAGGKQYLRLGWCAAAAAALSCAGGKAASVSGSAPTAADQAALRPAKLELIRDADRQASLAEDAFYKGLPVGGAQRQRLCGQAKPSQDVVTKAFCQTSAPPALHGLADLLSVLGLKPEGTAPRAAFALLGHSSSLVMRFASAINPRAILFTAPTGSPMDDFVILAFVRGTQSVEIIANDPAAAQDEDPLRFYLLRFTQACNAKPGGCAPLDLYTPAIEANWAGATLYRDDDLVNTVADCRVCHQPMGPTTRKTLRMPEILPPHTHYLSAATVGGKGLYADFFAAHGHDEAYAQIPPALLAGSDPAALAALLTQNGWGFQINAFNSAVIEAEVRAAAPGQPLDNSVAGTSATWKALRTKAVEVGGLAPPYHDVKVTDPALLPALVGAYGSFKGGGQTAATFPDLRQALRKAAEPDMGLAPAAGANGPGLLIEACGFCHNPGLDPKPSRAKFQLNPAALSAEEKQLAITRMQLPASDPKHMPPADFMQLGPAELALAIKTLTP